jgi:hypothetical protein
MDDPKQKRCRPSEVKDGDSLAAGMLNEPGKSTEQRRDAQADDDGDNDANVKVKVGAGGREGHESSARLQVEGYTDLFLFFVFSNIGLHLGIEGG